MPRPEAGPGPIPTDWTIVLSGPKATRAALLAALERAGTDLSDGQPDRDPSHGLPPHTHHGEGAEAGPCRHGAGDDPTVGWLTVRHADVDEIGRPANPAAGDAGGIATRAGWQVRAHRQTPRCPAGCVDGRINQPDGSGLGTCLHCRGKGVTNRRLPSREDLLERQLDEMRARLAQLEARQ